MTNLTATAWSSVGRKFLTGLTGFALFGYIIIHVLGNLLVFGGRDAFNRYAHTLETLANGAILPVVEIGLLLVVLLHIVSAVTVYLDKLRARPVRYARVADAGGASRKTIASQTMIYSGALLLVFLVFHVIQFRFTHIPDMVTQSGERMGDLYRLEAERFQSTGWVAFYLVAVVLLGFHLRHGFWSMFQSMGWTNLRTGPVLYKLAIVLAVVLTIAFFIIPLYVHNSVDLAPLQAGG